MFFLVSDKLVSELKSSLSLEKQKCSLLNEEVKIKKGAVERLRSDLENTKEQLQYMTEEKGINLYLKTEIIEWLTNMDENLTLFHFIQIHHHSHAGGQ